MHAHSVVLKSLWLCDPMDCSLPGSSVGFSRQTNIGVGCHVFLQRFFLTQGLNPLLLHLLHSLPLCHLRRPSPVDSSVKCILTFCSIKLPTLWKVECRYFSVFFSTGYTISFFPLTYNTLFLAFFQKSSKLLWGIFMLLFVSPTCHHSEILVIFIDGCFFLMEKSEVSRGNG